MAELQNNVENPVTINLSPRGEISLRIKPINLPASATATTTATTVTHTTAGTSNIGLLPHGGEMSVEQLIASRMRAPPPATGGYPGTGYPTGGYPSGPYPSGPATYAPP